MTSAQGICSGSSQDQQTLLLRFGLSNNDFKGTVSLISSDPPCKYDNVRFTGMRKIPSFFLLKKCFSFCKLLFFTTKPKIKPKMHCLKKQKHAYLSTINYDQCKVVFNLDPPLSETLKSKPNNFSLRFLCSPYRSVNNLKHCESIHFQKLNKEYFHIKN